MKTNQSPVTENPQEDAFYERAEKHSITGLSMHEISEENARLTAENESEKAKNKVLMFQSATSGLWYYNYQAAGDVIAIRLKGEIYIRQNHHASSMTSSGE